MSSAPLRGLIFSSSARESFAHKKLEVAYLVPHLITCSGEGITNPEECVVMMTTQSEDTQIDFGGWPSLHPSNHTTSTLRRATS